jgi:glycyl-tRNA synthetase alpha subunit
MALTRCARSNATQRAAAVLRALGRDDGWAIAAYCSDAYRRGLRRYGCTTLSLQESHLARIVSRTSSRNISYLYLHDRDVVAHSYCLNPRR